MIHWCIVISVVGGSGDVVAVRSGRHPPCERCHLYICIYRDLLQNEQQGRDYVRNSLQRNGSLYMSPPSAQRRPAPPPAQRAPPGSSRGEVSTVGITSGTHTVAGRILLGDGAFLLPWSPAARSGCACCAPPPRPPRLARNSRCRGQSQERRLSTGRMTGGSGQLSTYGSGQLSSQAADRHFLTLRGLEHRELRSFELRPLLFIAALRLERLFHKDEQQRLLLEFTAGIHACTFAAARLRFCFCCCCCCCCPPAAAAPAASLVVSAALTAAAAAAASIAAALGSAPFSRRSNS